MPSSTVEAPAPPPARAVGGRRDVGVGRVPSRGAPLGLPVPHEHDFVESACHRARLRVRVPSHGRDHWPHNSNPWGARDSRAERVTAARSVADPSNLIRVMPAKGVMDTSARACSCSRAATRRRATRSHDLPDGRRRGRGRLRARPRARARRRRRRGGRRPRLGRPRRARTPPSAPGADVERHPADKDATDLELALRRARATRGAQRIVVVGGGGGRLDHFLANALLLARRRLAGLEHRRARSAMRVVIVVRGARRAARPARDARVAAPGRRARARRVAPRVCGARSRDETSRPASTRGVSNEIVAPDRDRVRSTTVCCSPSSPTPRPRTP